MTNRRSYIGKRVAATLIDYTIIFSLTFFYITIVGKPNNEGGQTVSGLPALIPILFWFLYFIIAEFFLGGTLGHLLLKLKIASLDNNPVTFSQIFLRRIADALEIVWCFGLIAFVLAKSTPLHQRLGDLWSKTLVTGQGEAFVEEKFDFEKK